MLSWMRVVRTQNLNGALDSRPTASRRAQQWWREGRRADGAAYGRRLMATSLMTCTPVSG